MARETTRVRKRERKNITSGVVHVNSSFNNTMVTITDAQGNTISWSSSGMMGFKGSRKSTPYGYHRHDANSAQRMPPTKAPPRLVRIYWRHNFMSPDPF